MIASGALVMIIGFVGCCGAIKESRVMLVIVSKSYLCSLCNPASFCLDEMADRT